MRQPLIVGLGGTASPTSSTEQALRLALGAAESAGARVMLFGGASLTGLPHYLTTATLPPAGQELVDAVRQADGLIIASPGYHGSISGLVKNAIDYFEETARDEARVYLDGIPVGLIVTAFGWQATGSTLATLRSIVHALRGWPTPLGAAINTSASPFKDGQCTDRAAAAQLQLVGQQVARFASLHVADPPTTRTT